MVPLFETRRPDLVAIAQNVLADAGIAATMERQLDFNMQYTYALLVADEADARRAQEILNESGPTPRKCPECGYDLRGLPEPRCPECGNPFSTGPQRPDWVCAGCGEHHDGAFTDCWRCGATRTDLVSPAPEDSDAADTGGDL